MDIFDKCLSILTTKQLKFIDNLEKICKSNNEESLNLEENTNSILTPFPDERKDLELYLDKLEDDLDDSKKIKFKKFLEYNDECNELMNILNKILDNLIFIQNQYNIALQKTSHVHINCEKILNQHKNLQKTFNAINDNLIFYREYEILKKKFDFSSIQLLNEDFLPSFNKLDECIQFFTKNSDFLEAKKYKNQFQNLQNQVLITIKNYIISNIQQNSNKILPKSNQDISQGENVFTLFYGKFQTFSSKIKFLVDILEKHEDCDENYQIYLNECHQSYFNARDLLISPILSAAIDEIINSHKNSMCSLMRNSGKMVLQICRDEHQLFFNFFNKTSKLLYNFIENLCLYLYNKLLPLVIKINYLETLAELCHIIKNEIIDDEFLIKSKELSAFSKVIDQLLQDVQERLIYRTNIFIQYDIAGYIPVEGDLAYPEKLEMLNNADNQIFSNLSKSSSMSSMTQTINTIKTLSEVALISSEYNQFAPNAESLNYHLWYPTVRRSIMCLTKLFRSLDQAIFQSLAQDVISHCIDSLDSAAQKISLKKNVFNELLFKIKHLLIIREQIAPFKIECTVREVSLDLEKVKNAALNLINKSDTIFTISTNNGLLSFLFEVQSTPQIIEYVLDPQRIVDNKIKISCEHFINECIENIFKKSVEIKTKLSDFTKIISCGTLVKSNEPDNITDTKIDKETENLNENDEKKIKLNKDQIKDINQEENKCLSDLKNCLNEFLLDANNQVVELKKLMKLYLSSEDTVAILFTPIRNNIIKKIDNLFNQIEIILNNQEIIDRTSALEKIFNK